jgi:D-glycero-beta-D-manno-heptose-7-phosphate kinase
MEALLKKIANVRVLVVGDIMLDHYIWGDTQRISPEAPVPVVEVTRDEYRAGGAANVTLNIRSLGANAELAGWIGDDDAGKQLLNLFDQNDIHFDKEWIHPGVPSIVKTRVMVRTQQLCRLDREALPQAYTFEFAKHESALKEKINACDAVILSDYAKGILNQKTAQSIIEFAHQAGKIVGYDPKPRALMTLREVDLMTPNKAEAFQLTGIIPMPGEPFPGAEICKAIWDKYAPKHLIITLGAEGMLLSHGGNAIEHIPTYAREVFDVSGAGDTVIAALTCALAAGADLREAAHLANTAAGVVVAKMGTASANVEEILNYSEEH